MTVETINGLFPADLRDRLISLRRDLHRHPELSLQEERTAKRLHDELALLKPTVLKQVAGTGIVARFKGRDPSAPVVAVRGDIDALPIQEETGLDYASQCPGVMHACGHDVHATWAVGAAHLLSRHPAAGDVVILLQPAEEQGDGALLMIKGGALDGVDAIVGGHVDRRFSIGQVQAEAGPVNAAADVFEITLLGTGAHGARPHEAADPIVGAAALVTELQTIVSRRINPASPAVVTVGTIQAGSAPNVIPDRCTLSGTLRSFDPATRDLLHSELTRIAESVAALHRLRAQVTLEHGSPPVINRPAPAEWARAAVTNMLGSAALTSLGFLNMGGEDFAYYLEKIPGCFLRIGAREEGGAPIPAHSPKFYAADEAIFVGAAVLAETARIAGQELLKGGAGL
ncbi:MAG: amidohydrolase [Gemmatimonadetes bacterium]|nr:amidohydrolase [Gemmatimonadota bacterium]